MDGKSYFLVVGVMILASIYIINVDYVNAHENAHKAIFEHNGCLNASISVNYLYGNGSTTCEDWSYDASDNDYNRVRLLHGINEIVGYQLRSLMFLLSVFFIILLAVLMVK